MAFSNMNSPRGLALGAFLALAALQANGQGWRIEPSASTMLNATNNKLGPNGSTSEATFDITPALSASRKGARYTFDADASLQGLSYLQGTQRDRFLPRADVALTVIPVERWVKVDSSILVEQLANNPYVSLDSTQTSNPFDDIVTARRYRLSPAVEHEFTPSVFVLARADNLWTRRSNSSITTSVNRNSHVERDSFRLEQRPLPLGGWVQVSRERTEYATNVGSAVDFDGVRAGLTYGSSVELRLGVSAGRERSRVALERTSDNVFGADVDWRPTERSQAKLSLEKRFFGTGGGLELTHRSPFGALSFNLSRQPITQTSSTLLAPANGDLAALLNATYTTRVPDAAERAELVRNIIATLGLTPIIAGPVDVFATYTQLNESASLGATLVGRTTLITLGAYVNRSTEFRRPGSPTSLVNPRDAADNRQIGGSFDVNRRLTPSTAINLGLRVAQIRGLGARAGESNTEKALTLGANHTVSPRSSVNGGLRYRILSSTATASTSNETTVFVGARHRF
jgi:uncharacterized protein (PEP-CTERM system associated)